jgi:hypothetical protein
MQAAKAAEDARRMRDIRARMCSFTAKLMDAYGRLESLGPLWQNHHVLQNAAMKNVANYTRYRGISIPLWGGSRIPGSPHDLANKAQLDNKGQPADEVAKKALEAAGCRKADVDKIMKQVDTWVADGLPLPM